jgi:hypothetical protein
VKEQNLIKDKLKGGKSEGINFDRTGGKVKRGSTFPNGYHERVKSASAKS